ncbi:hypothetical protein PRUPE_2G025500 [Prunus persica]|uniref:Uncharacterized protein n=1 Tax=Prunus persica TaxID=3760 RepID=A0A251Q9V3_PRUPE|nr:hypothetical protein PRUPE_2G025500 [Prunus persica]
MLIFKCCLSWLFLFGSFTQDFGPILSYPSKNNLSSKMQNASEASALDFM